VPAPLRDQVLPLRELVATSPPEGTSAGKDADDRDELDVENRICKICPEGMVPAQGGAAGCQQCPPRTVAAQKGSETCETCPLGFEASEEARGCTLPVWYYAESLTCMALLTYSMALLMVTLNHRVPVKDCKLHDGITRCTTVKVFQPPQIQLGARTREFNEPDCREGDSRCSLADGCLP